MFKGICLKPDQVTFTQGNAVNLFIVYELDKLLQDLNHDFTVKDYLLGTVMLTKIADPDKCSYSLEIWY